MRTCPVCGKGELSKVEDIIFDLDSYVFVVKGERCDSCKEEIPYEDSDIPRKGLRLSKRL